MCFLWLRKNQRDPNVLVPRQGGAIPEPERRGGECGAQVCRQRPLPQESALRNTAHGHSWQRAQQGTYSSSELGGDESISTEYEYSVLGNFPDQIFCQLRI